MAVRIIVVAVALLNGLWMLIDGSYVLAKGKYIGPGQPGPWSKWLSAMGLDPFKMGVPFIVLGTAWLACLLGLALRQNWGWVGLFVCSALTLGYVPFGTVGSLIIIVSLVLRKSRVGYP
ncbi:hypothetical protein COHCIP112018_05647 [Cohnella sp. JJ-181]|nr:hypothetical protein COHCIP112018_05647 [Cohnella sp. JJ-181]